MKISYFTGVVDTGSKCLSLLLVMIIKLYVFFATSVETDLWSNVIRGSTESSCGRAFKYALFAHAKVCQLTVAVFVKKNVVQF